MGGQLRQNALKALNARRKACKEAVNQMKANLPQMRAAGEAGKEARAYLEKVRQERLEMEERRLARKAEEELAMKATSTIIPSSVSLREPGAAESKEDSGD